MAVREYRVVENFISINGEGKKAGELALFIRFAVCNLSCSYCDTSWANGCDAPFTGMTADEIMEVVSESGVRNVTITGGEPLIQEGMAELLDMLSNMEGIDIEIETNGSVPISGFDSVSGKRPSFTMDYKLPSSGMESMMHMDNLGRLTKSDTLKFVSGSIEDLERAHELILEHDLTGRTDVYFSPVFGSIEPESIVEFMKAKGLNGARLQLQLHKYIWDPDKTGV